MSRLLRQLPGFAGHGQCACSRLQCLCAGGCTGSNAFGNALQNGRQAKHVVGQVEVPVTFSASGVMKPVRSQYRRMYSSSDGMPSTFRSSPAMPWNAPGSMCHDMQW